MTDRERFARAGRTGERRSARIVALPTGAALALLLACGGTGSTGTSVPTGPDTPVPPVGCGAVPSGVSLGGDANAANTRVQGDRRVVLMGGGPEDDAAMTDFLVGAGGGDVVVLRVTGSVSSYPSYFRNDLSPDPVPATYSTVKIEVPTAGSSQAVLCRVRSAEAIWLAGGNQWNYLGQWPSALHSAISTLAIRGGTIGGTSAGAASLGEFTFDARLGSVTSAEVLADPNRVEVSLSPSPFPAPELFGFLVDSHFMERDREGRLLGFLGRTMVEAGIGVVAGIGLDERVALVIQGDEYRVSTVGEGAAWLYLAEDVPELLPDSALTMTGIRRLRLGDGATGAWPPSFEVEGVERMEVERGVVRVLDGG